MRRLRMFACVGATTVFITGLFAPAVMANSTSIVLCEAAELVCEKPFANPTTITAHAVEPKLPTSLGTVVCKKSLVELTVLNTLSTLGVGHILNLEFEDEEDCHLGKTLCQEVKFNTIGLLSFTKTGALTGNAKSTGGTKVTVKCGSLIHCKYEGEPTFAIHSTASGETKLLATNTPIPNDLFSLLCPDTSEFVATYTALGAMWIES